MECFDCCEHGVSRLALLQNGNDSTDEFRQEMCDRIDAARRVDQEHFPMKQ